MKDARGWSRSVAGTLAGLALTGVVAQGLYARPQPAIHSVSHSRMQSGNSTPSDGHIRATQAVSVTVRASAVHDSNSGAWTYWYAVANDSSSRNDVDHFAIAPIATLIRIDAPAHWDHLCYPYRGRDSGVVWAAVDVGELPPGYIDTGNIPPSAYAIHPGDSLVFSFTTLAPPVPEPRQVNWFAQGFDTLPDESEEVEDVPQGTVFTDAVTGTAVGPDWNSREREGDGLPRHPGDRRRGREARPSPRR